MREIECKKNTLRKLQTVLSHMKCASLLTSMLAIFFGSVLIILGGSKEIDGTIALLLAGIAVTTWGASKSSSIITTIPDILLFTLYRNLFNSHVTDQSSKSKFIVAGLQTVNIFALISVGIMENIGNQVAGIFVFTATFPIVAICYRYEKRKTLYAKLLTS